MSLPWAVVVQKHNSGSNLVKLLTELKKKSIFVISVYDQGFSSHRQQINKSFLVGVKIQL